MMLRRRIFDKENIDWRTLYTEIEYLESTGTQCIDTNYIPSSLTDIELVKGSNTGSVYNFIFGTGTSNNQYSIGAQYINYYTNLNQTITNNPQNAACTIKITKGVLSIDNNNYLDFSNTSGISQVSLALYCRKTEQGAYERFTGFKIYSCKIWDNDILVRNLIPCYRKSDNKPGMYDTVTETFFTNSGTGEFTIPS